MLCGYFRSSLRLSIGRTIYGLNEFVVVKKVLSEVLFAANIASLGYAWCLNGQKA